MTGAIDQAREQTLARARRHAAMGEDRDATAAYLELLRDDPEHLPALLELSALAFAGGHRAAARTASEQAVRCHPGDPAARSNLGNILFEDGDLTQARSHFEAAIAAKSDFAPAHRGLAQLLAQQGEPRAADRHWRQSFAGQAIVAQPYRSSGPPVRVLLLVSVGGGNIPTGFILDDKLFAVTVLYAEYYDPGLKLPSHDVIFNAIGDADFCPEALAQAEAIAARSKAPIVNPPERIRRTGRARNAVRLAKIPDLKVPAVRALPRASVAATSGLDFPLLLRVPGFHTGRHFLKVERPQELPAVLAQLPGEEILAIEYVRPEDETAHKYRVMIIDGVLYPVHLAISSDWKVHYFTAAMADNARYRALEKEFLENMAAVLGARAVAALQRIGETLALDYAGIDFALRQDGSVLFFEANATMVINPPDPDPIWDYRRRPIARALEAAKRMLIGHARSERTWTLQASGLVS